MSGSRSNLPAIDVLKEYASFGYQIPEIKEQMLHDGYQVIEIESALNVLRADGDWKNYLLNSISQLQRQGLSAENTVKLLGISDEEYQKCAQYLDAVKKSLTPKEHLLMLADNLDLIAQQLVTKIINPSTNKRYLQRPKEISKDSLSPENLLDAPEVIKDQMDKLESLIGHVEAVSNDVAEAQKLVSEYQGDINNSKAEVQELANGIVDAVKSWGVAIDSMEEVLTVSFRSCNQILSISNAVTESVVKPSIVEKYNEVMRVLEEHNKKLYSSIVKHLTEWEAEKEKVTKTYKIIVAMFPQTSNILRQRGSKVRVASWFDSAVAWLHGMMDRVVASIEEILSLEDDAMVISEQIDDLSDALSIRAYMLEKQGRL